VNGTLPAEGTKCEPDVKLFDNATAVGDLFAPIANYSKRAEADDDERLIRAVRMLSGKFAERFGA